MKRETHEVAEKTLDEMDEYVMLLETHRIKVVLPLCVILLGAACV